ncbi:MAG: putative ABC transporter permease [Lachnospira eligens]
MLMRYYAVSQWLIFSLYIVFRLDMGMLYVSVRKHKWVNERFLHGPFLPIYGSGAIVILISTIAVKDIVPLVFLLGMVSSTILEFYARLLHGEAFWCKILGLQQSSIILKGIYVSLYHLHGEHSLFACVCNTQAHQQQYL